jgi:hypothetical protein
MRNVGQVYFLSKDYFLFLTGSVLPPLCILDHDSIIFGGENGFTSNHSLAFDITQDSEFGTTDGLTAVVPGSHGTLRTTPNKNMRTVPCLPLVLLPYCVLPDISGSRASRNGY